MKLTEPAIHRALREAAESGQRRDLVDGGCLGLTLRVTPRGGAAWVLRMRGADGVARRFPVGEFPGMDISAARTAANVLRVRVRHDGHDPLAERAKARAAARAATEGADTLAALLDAFGRHRGAQLKSWTASRKRIECVFRALLGKPLGELTSTSLQIVADAHPSPSSGSFAVRTLRPALRWGARRGYLAAGVAAIEQPAPTRRRERFLDRGELAALLPALAASDRPHAKAMQFMLWTAARREEACGAIWSHVNLSAATWLIPAEASKNGKERMIPLSHQAVSMLRGIWPRDDEGQPVAPNGGALVFANKQGGRLGHWTRETRTIQKASGVNGWHRHDLRRTAATMMGELGEAPHVVEAALGHAAIHSGLASIYNRSRYGAEVRSALQRLADALDAIEAGGAEIIPLHAARA